MEWDLKILNWVIFTYAYSNISQFLSASIFKYASKAKFNPKFDILSYTCTIAFLNFNHSNQGKKLHRACFIPKEVQHFDRWLESKLQGCLFFTSTYALEKTLLCFNSRIRYRFIRSKTTDHSIHGICISCIYDLR